MTTEMSLSGVWEDQNKGRSPQGDETMSHFSKLTFCSLLF